MACFTPEPAERPLVHRPRLSEYGWGRRAFLVGAALVGSVAFAYAADVASRNALWEVVRACAFDKATTGSPWPCLEVAGPADRGFAVLRPPFGRPDTILTPTRRILGLEDPQLQAPETPNYFALAFAARHWLGAAVADPRVEARVALAVNSRLARSQDQLHVHLGCIIPYFAERLHEGLGPKPRMWFRGPDMAPGLELWTYRAGTRDMNALAPFRLALRLAGERAGLMRMTLVAATVGDELVVAALRSRRGGWYAAAEDVIAARC